MCKQLLENVLNFILTISNKRNLKFLMQINLFNIFYYHLLCYIGLEVLRKAVVQPSHVVEEKNFN